MLAVKKFFPNNKWVSCCIYTSAVKNCEKLRSVMDTLLKEDSGSERLKKNKKNEYPEETVSFEEKQKAKNGLKELLSTVRLETEENVQCVKETNLRELLKIPKETKVMVGKKKKNLGEIAVQAAEKVAQEMGGDVDKIKKDLLDHLMTIEITEPEVQKTTMKFSPPEVSVDFALAWKEIFSSPRLNIFPKGSEVETNVKLNIWDKLEQEELEYLALKPPSNQFEEWALWTQQGRLWRFPIDNDQGMESEASVDFTEHVFLDEHLDPWCPKKGPLKKFMDLVLLGLSKNPYLSVKDKKEHIFWYRDYFENKKQLLQELGALGFAKEIGDSANTQKN